MKAVLASSNTGKIVELKSWFPNISWVSQIDLGISSIPETGLSFIENAILKARHAAEKSNMLSLADDSGLIIDALDGRPGLYSARYAGTDNFKDNIAKVLSELKNTPLEERTARFCCTLAIVRSSIDPCPIIATGFWEGFILEAPQGLQGFGYDPIFFDPKIGLSAAEISMSEKNKISHRAHAISELKRLWLADTSN